MKTRLTLLCLIIPFFAQAQSPADDFYFAHKNRNNSISLSVGNFLLTAGSWFIEEDGVRRLVKKSRRARILFSDEDNFVESGEINQLIRELKRDDFESLAHIRTGDTKFDMYAREDKKGYIRNILLLLNETDEFPMVSLDCKFRMDDVQCLLNEL